MAKSNDEKLIVELLQIAPCKYTIEDGMCVSLSFFDEDSAFGGLIRHNPQKHKIVSIIQKFQNLKYLNLRKCKMGEISLNCPNLEFVDLSCNNLVRTPEWIYSLSSLKYLNLGSNEIKTFEFPVNLKTIKLHKNPLESFSNKPTNSLMSLNLYLNRLKKVPNWLWELKNLENFAFGICATDISGIGNFSSLQYLTLVANNIQNIPDEFCNLKKLRMVNLSKNYIQKLPNSIGEMNIKELYIMNNQINTLPDSFFDLQLNIFNCKNNNLKNALKCDLYSTYCHIQNLEL